MNLQDILWLKGKQLDIFVESFSNAARTIEIRGLTKNEQILHNHTTNADRTLATSAIGISEIPLFLTASTVETSVSRGETYVKVSLRVNETVVALLFAGYVTDAGAPIFPGGEIRSSIEGPGLIRSITGTDPADNVQISETVPTGARWKPLSISFALVTDATGGNRVVRLELDDGTTIYSRTSPNALQSASKTFQYTFAPTLDTQNQSGNELAFAPMPLVLMLAGHRIRTTTLSFQVTDNFGAPQLLVEEWLEP